MTDLQRYKYDIIGRIRDHSVKCDNGCIEYRTTKHKYGLISVTINGKRKSVPAHRAHYMALHDCFDLPSSVVIRHTCDNPRCVREDHLVRGTHKDNAKDKLERDRNAKKYHLHTRFRNVTDETIKAIRAESDKVKHWHIAEKYGVSIGYVSKIRNMKAKTLVQ